MKLFVVIPAYNEEKNIDSVIKNIKSIQNCNSNIVVVDDGSSDSTFNIANQNQVQVLRHVVNLGKGAALRTGCDYAIQKGADVIIAVDADGQHDPNKIPEFVDEIKDNQIVFGFRTLGESMPFVLRFGNWFINKTTAVLFNIRLKDTQCGYRAFTSNAYKNIRWSASDYSMESEMIAKTGKSQLKYTQLSIQTIYSDKYKGTTVLDGILIICKMVWWRLSLK